MSRKKNGGTNLNTYIEKGTITIFNATAIVISIGYMVDIIIFNKSGNIIFYDDLIAICLILITLLAYHLSVANIKTSFAFIVYVVILNIFVGALTDFAPLYKLDFFLRNSLFIILLLTLVSLISNKIHAIVIGVLYVGEALVLNILLDKKFLHSSIILIVLIVASYSFVVYYFVDILEKSIFEREQQNQLIKEQNGIVNEVNTLLEERQQQIEEQSERLSLQTEKLKEQSELLVIKNEELGKLNNTKDKFMSILAHDLKNPFNLLMGFSELLETNFNKLDDTKKMKYIGAISVTLKNTYNLLENLLQWARAQSDAIQFDPKKMSLSALIKKNLYFFQESYNRKNITLAENIKNDLNVVADENMLDAVVRNLLTNAIKFTPDNGKITVSCMDTDNKVKVEITDTGIGISRDNLKSLFNTDTLITPGTYGETGTGLGLLICHDFVNKNNGEIWVDSEEGKGSTFTFTIPVVGD